MKLADFRIANALIIKDLEGKPEEQEKVLEMALEGSQATSKSVARHSLIWILSVATYWALARHALTEFSLAGFKVLYQPWVIHLVPLVIGFSYYQINVASISGMLQKHFISECFKQRHPIIYKTGLFRLLAFPSSISESDISNIGYISRGWSTLFVVLHAIIVVSISLTLNGVTFYAAAFSTSYSPHEFLYGIAFSIGLIYWLRGVWLLFEFTGVEIKNAVQHIMALIRQRRSNS